MWLLHIVGYVFIVAFLSKSKELLVFKGLYFVLTIAHTEKLLEYEWHKLIKQGEVWSC